MPRVTRVAKARPSEKQRYCRRCRTEIKVGEPYYWFANKLGRSSRRSDFCKNHYPRPSELTTSDKLSNLYAARESIEDAFARADREGNVYSFEDFKSNVTSALDDAASSARDVAQEYRDSKENMPESLQESEQAQGMEEKADNIESWADSLDDASSEIDSMEPEVGDDASEEEKEDAVDRAIEEVENKAQEAIDALEV